MANVKQNHAVDSLRLRPAQASDWVGIAANAASGRGQGRKLVDRLTRELDVRGLETRVAWTIPDRQELIAASRTDDRCRCLIAAGGDGTVSSLLNESPQVPVAVLPAGTENLFANHYRFGQDLRFLAEAIDGGEYRRMDLGNIGGRRFALMAGFGFDADVVNRHHAVRTRGTGQPRPTNRAEYVDPVLRSSFLYRFPRLRLTLEDQETIEGTTAFVFNLPRYALGLPFAPAANGEDGLLDVVVFRNGGPFQALHYLWLVVRGLHLRRPGIYHRQVRKVWIEADTTIPIQLDGDPGGELTKGKDGGKLIEVSPSSVNILVVPERRSSTTRKSERLLESTA